FKPIHRQVDVAAFDVAEKGVEVALLKCDRSAEFTCECLGKVDFKADHFLGIVRIGKDIGNSAVGIGAPDQRLGGGLRGRRNARQECNEKGKDAKVVQCEAPPGFSIKNRRYRTRLSGSRPIAPWPPESNRRGAYHGLHGWARMTTPIVYLCYP